MQAPHYALGSSTALHPSSKVSQSPELPYAQTGQWGHVKVDTAAYYDEREQPASPASSSGSHYGPQSQPVSPSTPYAYGHYGSQSQTGLANPKYESSPSECSCRGARSAIADLCVLCLQPSAAPASRPAKAESSARGASAPSCGRPPFAGRLTGPPPPDAAARPRCAAPAPRRGA